MVGRGRKSSLLVSKLACSVHPATNCLVLSRARERHLAILYSHPGQRRQNNADSSQNLDFDGAFRLRSSSSGLGSSLSRVGSPQQDSPTGGNSPYRGGSSPKQRPSSAISSPMSVLKSQRSAVALKTTSLSSTLSGICCPELPVTLQPDVLNESVAKFNQCHGQAGSCDMRGELGKCPTLSQDSLSYKSMLGLPDSVLVRIGRSRDAFME
jgi:hypothetical protein